MDALVRAPLLPAADAALVPAAYTARRVERDSASIPGTMKPDTAHVTVLSRREFAAAQQKMNVSSRFGDSDGSGEPKEQLLAQLRPLLLDVPEPLGFGRAAKNSTSSSSSSASSFQNSYYGTSSSSGAVASDTSLCSVSAEAYFVAVCWPSGQSLRRACGLPPKDFHATLGFGPSGDVHDVPKGASSLLKPRPWRDLLALAKSYTDAAVAVTTATTSDYEISSCGEATSMNSYTTRTLPASARATFQLEAAVSAASAALMAIYLDPPSATHGSGSDIKEINGELTRARAEAAVLAARSIAFLQLGDNTRAAADANTALPLLEEPKDSSTGGSSEDSPGQDRGDDDKLRCDLNALLEAATTAAAPPPLPVPATSASSSSSLSLPLAPPGLLLNSLVLPKVPISRIFMDLDGVLADFDGGVRALTGKGPSDLSSREMVRKLCFVYTCCTFNLSVPRVESSYFLHVFLCVAVWRCATCVFRTYSSGLRSSDAGGPVASSGRCGGSLRAGNLCGKPCATGASSAILKPTAFPTAITEPTARIINSSSRPLARP